MQLTGKFKFKTFYVEICFFSTLEVSNFAVFFGSLFTGMFWRNSNSQAGTMRIQGCRISTIYDGRYNNEYPLMWLKGCLCRGHVTGICKVILFIGLLWLSLNFWPKKPFLLELFRFVFVLDVSPDIRGNRLYGSTPVKQTVNIRNACVYNLLCLFLYETANPIVNLVLMCVVTERQYGNIVLKFSQS